MDKPDENKRKCTGLDALFFSALDSGVELVTGVPGYPITALMERFLSETSANENSCQFSGVEAKWLTNEKVALELALGASATGRRALVLVKHVGMNLLSDPLITSVTHTIGAGLVIVAGDDPGVKASQNEQDSRWYGKLAELAIFDPQDPDTAYRSLRRAYALSEELKIPVILRLTARLEESRGKIKRFSPSKKPFSEFDPSIWGLRMREKHWHFHEKVYPRLEAEAENTDLNSFKAGRMQIVGDVGASFEEVESEEESKIGVISSGFASALVAEGLKNYPEVSQLSLNLVNPLPFKKIRAFLKKHEIILVAEESEPFIEEQLCITGKVRGKKTGHLPYGQLLLEHLEFALEHIKDLRVEKPFDAENAKARKKSRTSICASCAFLPLYHVLRQLDVWVAGDMGCSVRSAPKPLAAVDVSFALGSAISVACGFKKKGIAVIGDFALAHSGILGLMNAVQTGAEVLVLVLENQVAAMTGGQKVPELQALVKILVPDTLVYDLEGTKGNEEKKGKAELSDLIRAKLDQKGISVIFIRGKCTKYI